jgi:thiol-disulfide isomerase/thioredoxin
MSSAVTIRAPDLDMPGIAWLNVNRPLKLSELRGRLVILDFWTFCCINCLHSLETLRRLEDAFPRELVVIGVHSPKFTAERDLENVRQAVLRHRISHPIAHDPDRQLWECYAVGAWPTLVIISPDGHILSETRGEPDPDQLQSLVQQLLDAERAGNRLHPAALELRAESSGGGRFRFPAKVKPMAGVRQRWAIADAGNHQIVLLEDDGTELQRFGDGQPGFKDGPGHSARFDTPQGLVCSGDAIFVADTGNHAIRRIDIGERTVRTLAGTGRRGQPLGAPRPARQVALASPWDLELDGAQLFIANAGTHQLATLDLERGRLGLLAGSGREALVDGAAYEASLAQPSGLVLDDGGDVLYFVDSESSAVRALSLDGQRKVTTICGRGLFEFGHVNGLFAKALFQHPLGISWSDGALLVADSYNCAVRRIDLDGGNVSDVDDGFMCEDSLCLTLAEPSGVWADGGERVLVADTNNHRVLEYRVGERRSRTWAG